MSKQLRRKAICEDHPAYNTRADKFAKCYALVVEELERELVQTVNPMKNGAQKKYLQKFNSIEFAVQNCPESFNFGIQYGKFFPPDGIIPARMTIYRLIIEQQAKTRPEQFDLIHSVVKPVVWEHLGFEFR